MVTAKVYGFQIISFGFCLAKGLASGIAQVCQ